MGLQPDLACIGETVADDSYCYLLPKEKRDHTRAGVLIVLNEWIGLIVTLTFAQPVHKLFS
jgi:hypothetical protein